jgi:hypothetical protein
MSPPIPQISTLIAMLKAFSALVAGDSGIIFQSVRIDTSSESEKRCVDGQSLLEICSAGSVDGQVPVKFAV